MRNAPHPTVTESIDSWVQLSPSVWPTRRLRIQPGDLARFAPMGRGRVGPAPADLDADGSATGDPDVFSLTAHQGNPLLNAPITEPTGGTLYLDGQRVFTVSDLTHLTWNSATGAVTILGTPATVNFNTSGSLPTALNVNLSGNARMVDIAQRAGVDLSAETGSFPNLAVGRTATASFSGTNLGPANAVDGFTVSGIPVTVGSWTGLNPIWGTTGLRLASDPLF